MVFNRKISQRKYRRSDKGKESQRKYRKKNPEKVRGYVKKSYIKHKEQRKKEVKEWQKKNSKKCVEYSTKWQKNNKEKHAIAVKKWTDNNIDKVREIGKKWVKNNPNKVKRYIANWRNNHHKEIREYNHNYGKQRRKTDKNFALICNIRAYFCAVLKKYTKTGKDRTMKKYGIDIKGIVDYVGPKPQNQGLQHLDHKKPLCTFNFINKDKSTNIEEIQKAFVPENFQWLSIHDNCSKGGKWNGE